jgi:hypothetical protein
MDFGFNHVQFVYYWVERKVLAFSKRWPFFEALSSM